MTTLSHKDWKGLFSFRNYVLLACFAAIISGCQSPSGPQGGHAKQQEPVISKTLPVRGLHLSAPPKNQLPAFLDFIRGPLAKEGVNTLIVEFDYRYDFQSRPEFGNPSFLGKSDVQQIVKACRESRIELIPMINCLGHQSWSRSNGLLLTKHPEFDETPNKYPGNKDVYCRSYCPLHPGVHAVLFDLIDELAKACEAKAFHVGMDEVFILADSDCPRCQGKDPADLFAGEVTLLEKHLKSIGCRTWIWGDRFLNAQTTKLGKWEASDNGTAPAIDRVPKTLVICDWHYDKIPETAPIFASKGFDVVSCPWRKHEIALAELAQMKAMRTGADKAVASHALGMVHTTWIGFAPFRDAYQAQAAGAAPVKVAGSECAYTFRTLFKAIRDEE